ncbi:MAG: 6-bladed beta-propeller [Phycisphaerae bacterium]|nr:6-bladed beta-propeller [Phycisphaerae bacterium]
MNRRDFLKLSGQGLAALGLAGSGCLPQTPPSSGGVASVLAVSEEYLVFDPEGVTYELRPSEHKVLRLGAFCTPVWEVGGLGTEHGELNYPVAMDVDSQGRLYVVDLGNSRIEVYDKDGNYLRQIGPSRVEGATDRSYLNYCRHIDIDSQDRIYVCDSADHQVHVFDTQGDEIREFGEFGTEAGELNYPVAVAIDSSGNLHVVDKGNARVQVYAPDGTFLRSYGDYGTDRGGLQTPRAILIDASGNSYIADSADAQIDVFGSDGSVKDPIVPTFADGRGAHPMHLSWTPDGSIYVTALPASA